MPSVYKMIATVMIQSGFEQCFGLGRNIKGIVKHIHVFAKGEKFGLGYIPQR